MLGIYNYNNKPCKKYLVPEHFKGKNNKRNQKALHIKITDCFDTLSIGCMDPWVG